jgi:hypothetical protein
MVVILGRGDDDEGERKAVISRMVALKFVEQRQG